RAYLNACPPQAHNLPRLLDNASLYIFHQLRSLLLVALDFLLIKELVDHWIFIAAPVCRRATGELGHNLIGVSSRGKAKGVDKQLKIPGQAGLTPGGALLHLMFRFNADLLPG